MARKFTFNLQKYLDYKESIVNGKAADLIKSKKLLDKENNKLEKLFDEKKMATLDYKKNKPSRILDLAIMSSYVNQISKNNDKSYPNVPVILSTEKETNPFLRSDKLEIKRLPLFSDKTRLEIFTALRQMKDNF